MSDFEKQAKAIIALLRLEGELNAEFDGDVFSYSITSLVKTIHDRYIVLKGDVIAMNGKEWNDTYQDSDRYLIFDSKKRKIIGVLIDEEKMLRVPPDDKYFDIIERYNINSHRNYVICY